MKRSNAKWLGIGALALAAIVPIDGYAHSGDSGRHGVTAVVVDQHARSDHRRSYIPVHSDAWNQHQWYRWRMSFAPAATSRWSASRHQQRHVDLPYDHGRWHHDRKAHKHYTKHSVERDGRHDGKNSSNDRGDNHRRH